MIGKADLSPPPTSSTRTHNAGGTREVRGSGREFVGVHDSQRTAQHNARGAHSQSLTLTPSPPRSMANDVVWVVLGAAGSAGPGRHRLPRRFVCVGLTSHLSADYPACLVATEYLTALEGPFWMRLRGKGLTYNYRLYLNIAEGLTYFSLGQSTSVAKAYKVPPSRGLQTSLPSPHHPWCETFGRLITQPICMSPLTPLWVLWCLLPFCFCCLLCVCRSRALQSKGSRQMPPVPHSMCGPLYC